MGNLGDSIQETDLHGVFGKLPGFKQLKLVRSGRNFTCFVQFGGHPVDRTTTPTPFGHLQRAAGRQGAPGRAGEAGRGPGPGSARSPRSSE